MKILIIALSGIGDALMFSPALRLLRKNYPDAQIDLLAMFKGVEEMYRRNPDVSNVYFWDFLKSNPFATLSYVLSLRKHGYDCSFNVYPSNRWPYNLISFFAGAKQRFGHTYNHANLRSLNMLNNVRIHEDDRKHNVEENIDLITKFGVQYTEIPPLQLFLTAEDTSLAEDWLRQNALSDNKLIVGFHAGSSRLKNHFRRRWAPEKYAALGKILAEQYHATVLLFGGPEEYELNESINSQMGGKAVIVKTPSLMSSVALMKHCSLFVVNDSGLMHIAAGLQLPVVTIFAYTNPAYVYPWKTAYTMVRKDLECSPCFYYSPKPATCKWDEDRFRCITHIEVDEVLQAVRKFLNNTSNIQS